MTKALEYIVVNSFADQPFGGNPAAIFVNAEGLSVQTMQQLAKQMNLVESTFVVPSNSPEFDYTFRYFTPTKEVPIAGHPTIAAIIALVENMQVRVDEKAVVKIMTRAGIKELELIQDPKGLIVMMEQQAPQFLEIVENRNLVASVLGIELEDFIEGLPLQAVDTGLGHLIVPVKSLEALMRVQRRMEPLKELCSSLGVMEVQVFTFETYDPDKTLHTRNINPRLGVEDPACGVGNGALGAYLLKHYYFEGRMKLIAEQGHIVNMPSVVEIIGLRSCDDVKVTIGGTGKVMRKGTFFLE